MTHVLVTQMLQPEPTLNIVGVEVPDAGQVFLTALTLHVPPASSR